MDEDFCLLVCMLVLNIIIKVMFSERQTLKSKIAHTGVKQTLRWKEKVSRWYRDAHMHCSNRKRDVSEKLWRKNEGGTRWWIKSKKFPLVPPHVNCWHPLLHTEACLLGAPVVSAWGLGPGWGSMCGYTRRAREIMPLDSVWTKKNRDLEDKCCILLTPPLEQLVVLHSPSDYPNGIKLQHPSYHLLKESTISFLSFTLYLLSPLPNQHPQWTGALGSLLWRLLLRGT